MKGRATSVIGFAVAAIAFLSAVILYQRLPALMPTHWNMHGNVDGSVAKPWGVFIYPVMIALVAVLSELLPIISPKPFSMAPFVSNFRLIAAAVIGLLATVMATIFSESLGLKPPISRIALLASGTLLVVIGNLLGKTTRNFFLGIRTPWTLANAEVWSRTNRLGGRLLLLAGLLLIVSAAFGFDPFMPLCIVVALGLFPIVYSYWLYRRLNHAQDHPLGADNG